jgi:predicted transcriptional regulator
VLRALIWWKTGQANRSTQLAAKTGQMVAFCFIAWGIFEFFSGAGFGGLWIAFIGWFLLQAAKESYLQVGLAEALNGVRVSELMTRDCPTVDGGMSVQHFVEEQLLHTGQRCFIVTENGAVAGLITPHEVKQLDRANWPSMALHDIMRPLRDLRSVMPDEPVMSALQTMSRYDLNQLPVISDHHLEGVLSRAHLISYLQTHTELHG